MPALGLGLGLQIPTRSLGGLDPAVTAFASASGATDLTGLNNLIVYLKAQNLYDNFVIYPMKSAQNAGTGATVYSLGGLTTNNMTLVNSPTWGASGVTFNGTNQHGEIADFLGSDTLTVFDRFTINVPQDNDDEIINQWDTGANQRSWRLAQVNTGELSLSRDPTGNFSSPEVYTMSDNPFDNTDVTAVCEWVDGGSRSAWANKASQSLSLASGSAQTSRLNSTAKIGIMASFTNGTAQRLSSGLQTASAFVHGALTTAQRETITDYINAL